ncbi:hypothetical protein [Cuneatibacter caecimuris]|uniref:Uncharacterized protein n=1 Tax=Cuneatibacter caecimuris TaxID=1796618 RepID=A0A4Q7PPP5_9FIRM|nr:hypothetical protein [Cuneatibacter caecimuris]RZT02902.1 hypothetical protein EV209_1032 [Cuneatibacter caecimuris]
MSIGEVKDYLDAWTASQRRQFREQIMIQNYAVVDLSQRIGAMFAEKGQKQEILHLWDFFPDLFDAERKQFEDGQKDEELERFKADRARFVQRHNERWKNQEKGGET